MSKATFIGIDTNVLIRILVQDCDLQSKIAKEFLDCLSEDYKGFISIVTMIELIWVLDSRCKHSNEEIMTVIEKLLNAPMLEIQFSTLWRKIVSDPNNKYKDLSDLVIVGLGQQMGCDETVTFDRKAGEIIGARLLI